LLLLSLPLLPPFAFPLPTQNIYVHSSVVQLLAHLVMASPPKDAQTHMLAATASAAAVTAHLPTLQGFVCSSAMPAAGSPNTVTPAFTGLVNPQMPLPLLMLC
jgi:hypothetical protein